MAYRQTNSSDSDDDIPPKFKSLPQEGQVNHNHRQLERMLSHGRSEDMASEIHFMEQNAYSAVLKAFIAQSDAFSWDRQSLISELRKELNVSDMEHRSLLKEAESDNIVRKIRGYHQEVYNPHGSMAISSQSPSGTHAPCLSSSIKQQKRIPLIPPASHAHAPSEATGEGVPPRSHKRCSRNNWHESGEYEEFAQEDGNYGIKDGQFLRSASGQGILNGRRSNIQISSQNSIPNKKQGNLKLLDTHSLLKKVEQVYGSTHPDPIEKEKVRAMVDEHEKALIEAIARLGAISEDVHTYNGRNARMQNNSKTNGNRNQVSAKGHRKIVSDAHPMPPDNDVFSDDEHDSDEDI